MGFAYVCHNRIRHTGYTHNSIQTDRKRYDIILVTQAEASVMVT